jgi:hypothetical protein
MQDICLAKSRINAGYGICFSIHIQVSEYMRDMKTLFERYKKRRVGSHGFLFKKAIAHIEKILISFGL